jgi:thymidylate kinase
MYQTARVTETLLFSTSFFRGTYILKPILISFSGIDGAGKSTQIEKLRSYLLDAGVPVRQLTFWDNVVMFPSLRSGFSRVVLQSDGSVGTPEHPANRNDKNAQLWPLLFGRAMLYIFDVINLRRIVAKAQSQDGGVVIFDRYIYDQLAAMPMDSWLARSYAKVLLKLSPRPDLSYVLDAVPEEARARKPEYPVEFMHFQRKSYLRLRQMTGLQIIPAGGPDEVHAAILERFQKCVVGGFPVAQTSPVTA